MPVLQINPAIREELFTIDNKGKHTLDEGAFAESLVNVNRLVCYNGLLYDHTGAAIGGAECRKAIYDLLRGLGVTTNIANRVKNIYEVVKLQAQVDNIEVVPNEIAVENGTVFVNLKTGDISFSEEKKFSLHRLNCRVHLDEDGNWTKCKPPKRFMEWVDNLIHDYDKDGFQEYLGYLLLPVTKLQKAMVLLGRGQEGKSRIGLILQYLFGAACTTSTIEYFETNQYAMPRAENKLVLFQDDLKKDRLKSTEVFKMMVSAEVPLQAEQKHERTYSFQPYARWVICSNAPLLALSDSGHGFYRRLYVLRVKNRPPDRVDDPFYFEPMREEMDGIFIWFLAGLQRLIRNGWQLSVSDESKELVSDQQEQENSLISFVRDEVRFGRSYSVTTETLYRAYTAYCSTNQVVPQKRNAMKAFFDEQLDNMQIKKNKHLGEKRGQEGYVGMTLKSTASVLDLLNSGTDEGR